MGRRARLLAACAALCLALARGWASGPLPLIQFSADKKYALSWDPLTGAGFLEKEGTFVSFALDQPYMIIDWKRIEKIQPPYLSEGRAYLPQASAERISKLLEAPRTESKQSYSVAAILVDPGHGGKDSGAIADLPEGRIMEKELTLEVSRRVVDLLKSRYPGRRILVTRKGDSYPSLDDRVSMANDVELGEGEAVIYVSIHANASFNKQAKGYEVWYLNPEYRRTVVDEQTVKEKGSDIAPILNAMLEEEFTTESIILARKVYDRLGAEIGKSSPGRGIRAEEWFVVRNAKMPSILIEMGFITHPEEGPLLSSSAYLRRIGDAIYNGIVDFIDHFER